MLQIARHTDYAARIVLHLACLGENGRASIAEIAEQRSLPAFFVRRLIGRLVKGGILCSSRGANGGVRLARPAADISLLDLVRIMEGPLALNTCVDDDRACLLKDGCPVHSVWRDATRALEAHLSAVRFDRLATPSQSLHPAP